MFATALTHALLTVFIISKQTPKPVKALALRELVRSVLRFDFLRNSTPNRLLQVPQY